jgi:hypothetical protein
LLPRVPPIGSSEGVGETGETGGSPSPSSSSPPFISPSPSFSLSGFDNSREIIFSFNVSTWYEENGKEHH